MGKAVEDGVVRFTAGKLKVEIHPHKKAAGAAAAKAVAKEMERLIKANEDIAIIFATGASQIDMLQALISISGLPWKRIQGFHLDEYVGLDENHPASFRRYLREKLVRRVPMRAFFEIDGNANDLNRFCEQYAHRLELARPQLCLLGIGENGHLAFNDPSEANFNDPVGLKAVLTRCRLSPTASGGGLVRASRGCTTKTLTLTIPTIVRVPKLIATVPEGRKAQAVLRTIEDPITTACPSTILRNHPDVTIFLDRDSAAALTRRHFMTES